MFIVQARPLACVSGVCVLFAVARQETVPTPPVGAGLVVGAGLLVGVGLAEEVGLRFHARFFTTKEAQQQQWKRLMRGLEHFFSKIHMKQLTVTKQG